MPALLGPRGALKSIFMFEARFQSFDDSSERAQSAARVAELRSELKRRGLDGFVVPRADRQQNEYLPRERRTLGLADGIYRLGRRGGGPGRPCGTLRRRTLHGAGQHAGRRQDFLDRASCGAPARAVARTESEQRCEAWLRPLASHQRAGGKTAKGLRRRRRATGCGRQ